MKHKSLQKYLFLSNYKIALILQPHKNWSFVFLIFLILLYSAYIIFVFLTVMIVKGEIIIVIILRDKICTYKRSLAFKVVFIATSYMNDTNIDKQSSINQILWYLT